MEKNNIWFPFKSSRGLEYGIDVFCFYHAGGTASTYRKWTVKSEPIRFICIELPGKGTRRKEKFIYDYKLLEEDLADNIIQEAGNNKICFWGHSMGAAIAFYTACKIKNKYARDIYKLIVAGRQAPDVESLLEFKSYMGNDALMRELKKYEAVPLEILENTELMEFIIPNIRKDYKLNESLIYNNEKLNIPIVAHAGKYDYEADKKIMSEWARMTSSDFKIQEFEGSHFFVTHLGDKYKNELIKEILL